MHRLVFPAIYSFDARNKRITAQNKEITGDGSKVGILLFNGMSKILGSLYPS